MRQQDSEPDGGGPSPGRVCFDGGCPLVSASVATLGHVRGRGPMDTSSAKQDEVDIGRDGADAVGGTEPRPRGFPPQQRDGDKRKQDGGGDEKRLTAGSAFMI